MALNDVKFVLGKGGLGRPLPGEDFISGLVFYSATLPSGFSATNRMAKLFSINDAEALGIVSDYSDATAATGTYTVTAVGANGDTVELKVVDIDSAGNPHTTSLGIYKKVAADTTAPNVATAIAGIINGGTQTHGYSATVAAAVVTIIAPKQFGKLLNTGTPLSAVYSTGATLAGTVAQFTGGAASKFAVHHYHIAEFFRIQPQGVLYVGYFDVPVGAYTFTEITSLQNFANGSIRQVGIYKDAAVFATADVQAIHAICQQNVDAHKEIFALYAADISPQNDVSKLADCSQLNSNLCAVIIGQDGGALGNYLYLTVGKSITVLGAALGAYAKAKVSQSIAWVQNFNISDGTECDIPAFANGVKFNDPSVSDNLLSTLQGYAYTFLRKYVGVAGSYFNENRTAIAANSDYAYGSDNRTIQKATRGVYKSLIPALNSTIVLNSDGTLSDEAIAYLTGLAETNLIQMIRDGELSAQKVTIDPQQNILQTGILYVSVSLVQVATARNIIVNIGYTVAV